jgi:hypothetical protein
MQQRNQRKLIMGMAQVGHNDDWSDSERQPPSQEPAKENQPQQANQDEDSDDKESVYSGWLVLVNYKIERMFVTKANLIK